MSVALTSRSVVVTILVIIMLAAAFAIVCSDGIHSPAVAAVGGMCLAMTHSSIVGAIVGASGQGLVTTALLAVAAGLAMVSARPLLATARRAAPPERPIDALNGRLRL